GLRRVGAVPPLAMNQYRKLIGSGHHGPGIHADDARRQAWPVMQGVHRVAMKSLEEAVVEHGLSTAQPLFGRLENQDDPPIEVAGLGQVARSAQENGCVAVVTAGVHDPWAARTIRLYARLVDRQGIHVGAQTHRKATVVLFAVQDPHDARATNTGMHLIAQSAQHARHHGRSTYFLEAEFGVSVDVPSDGHELVVEHADGTNYMLIRHSREIPGQSGCKTQSGTLT